MRRRTRTRLLDLAAEVERLADEVELLQHRAGDYSRDPGGRGGRGECSPMPRGASGDDPGEPPRTPSSSAPLGIGGFPPRAFFPQGRQRAPLGKRCD